MEQNFIDWSAKKERSKNSPEILRRCIRQSVCISVCCHSEELGERERQNIMASNVQGAKSSFCPEEIGDEREREKAGVL